jgi:hypothetical protein
MSSDRPQVPGAGSTANASLPVSLAGESLLDLVDNVLNKGVVLTGDLTIALAGVDLLYARLSLLLCAADRVLTAHDASMVRRRVAPPRSGAGGVRTRLRRHARRGRHGT